MKLYSCVLTGLISLFLYLVFTRCDVQTSFLRAPGSMFQTTADGKLENLYTVKVVNKTMHDIPIEMRLQNIQGNVKVMGAADLTAPAAKLVQTSVLVELDPQIVKGANTQLKIGIYSKGKLLETVNTSFVGPRK